MDFDNTYSSFLDIKKEILDHLKNDNSEADTRSKIIDLFFKDILGWNEYEILREGHGEGGFFDYSFKIPGFKFLVEAKRSNIEFSLPNNSKKVKLNSFYKTNKEIVKQIRSYSFDQDTPYGVLTNGHQFIIGKFYNSDGTSWKNNTVQVFNGIDDIDNRFVDFYNSISFKSVVDRGAIGLQEVVKEISHKKIINTLSNSDDFLIRNSLSAEIQKLIESVFGDLRGHGEYDEELIKNCFVENNETKKNRSEIQRLFSDSIPDFDNIIPAVNTKNIQEQIGNELETDIFDYHLKPPSPIIITGSKGAGKSTFIKHLFINKLNSKNFKNHLIIYIEPDSFLSTEDLIDPDQISKVILDQIYYKYPDLGLNKKAVLKRLYKSEIQEIEQIFSETENLDAKVNELLHEKIKNYKEHLPKLSEFILRNRRKRLVVVIDNADQYNDTIQEKVFLFAHFLSKNGKAGTIISLREGYYYLWMNSPPFDAYLSNVYHITAPPFSEVLNKRLKFALNLKNKSSKLEGKDERGFKVKIDNQKVFSFLSSIDRSLLNDRNKEIIDFLGFSTFPNIREGLRLFRSFLTSGHTKVEEYVLRDIDMEVTKRTFQAIPFHEFLKSIALRNRLYYHSNESSLFNILSLDHFLMFIILKILLRTFEDENISDNNVYVENIILELLNIGYKHEQVIGAIKILINNSLVDMEKSMSDLEMETQKIGEENRKVSISSKGYFYLNTLMKRFSYLDLVLQDTPIYSDDYFEEIFKEFPKSSKSGKRSLKKRVLVLNSFIEYLEYQETHRSKKSLQTYGSIVEHMKEVLIKDINRITTSFNS